MIELRSEGWQKETINGTCVSCRSELLGQEVWVETGLKMQSSVIQEASQLVH